MAKGVPAGEGAAFGACQHVVISELRRTYLDGGDSVPARLEQYTNTAGSYALAKTGDDASRDEHVFHGSSRI